MMEFVSDSYNPFPFVSDFPLRSESGATLIQIATQKSHRFQRVSEEDFWFRWITAVYDTWDSHHPCHNG